MPKGKLDRAGRSPLHYAAAAGDTGEVARLIRDEADVNLRDNNGYTPLHFAAQDQRPQAANLLLEMGARIEEKDEHGNTPLWTAVFYIRRGNGEVIRLLRQWGADPFAKNNYSISPIQLAREDANHDLAKFFEDLPK